MYKLQPWVLPTANDAVRVRGIPAVDGNNGGDGNAERFVAVAL
jgi:hypothetical protein